MSLELTMEAKDMVAAVSTTVGLSGLVFGLYQYYVAQQWKKSEFAARQLERLTSESENALCLIFLDWSVRRVSVPEPYKAFTDEKFFVHSVQTMEEAMRPESEKGNFPFPQVIYRDCFDHLFQYLDNLNHYIEIGLIVERDVRQVEYWLRQIALPRFVPGKASFFKPYIERYGYLGVLRLAGKFGILI